MYYSDKSLYNLLLTVSVFVLQMEESFLQRVSRLAIIFAFFFQVSHLAFCHYRQGVILQVHQQSSIKNILWIYLAAWRTLSVKT